MGGIIITIKWTDPQNELRHIRSAIHYGHLPTPKAHRFPHTMLTMHRCLKDKWASDRWLHILDKSTQTDTSSMTPYILCADMS